MRCSREKISSTCKCYLIRHQSDLCGWSTPPVCADHLLIFTSSLRSFHLCTDGAIRHSATLKLSKGETRQFSEVRRVNRAAEGRRRIVAGLASKATFSEDQEGWIDLCLKVQICAKLLVSVLVILILFPRFACKVLYLFPPQVELLRE